MAPKGYNQHEFFFPPVSYTNRYANDATDGKTHLTSTGEDSNNCVFDSSATCTPAKPNTFDNNVSCKTDLQRAQENPDITDKDLPLAVISQDDK